MTIEEARRRKAEREKILRKKRQRTKQMMRRALITVGALVLIIIAGTQISRAKQANAREREQAKLFSKTVENAPDFEVELLTPNPYSRPQIALEEVEGIVIHYTANPGTSAQQNHDYFEGLKDTRITKASSHFIIGIDGEIIQCIPSSEIAYASNERNTDTLSIECCHKDESGVFSKETYESLVHLTAWLCGKFELTTEDVIRHYDVTGKACPVYYVDNPKEWETFLKDVEKYIDKYGKEAKEEFS